MNNLRKIAVAAAFLLAVVGLAAFAQTGTGTGSGAGTGQGHHWAAGQNGPGSKGMRGNHLAFLANALNLTDAQKAQAKVLFQDARQKSQPVRQQLQSARQNLEQAIKTDNQAGIQTAANSMSQLQSQLIVIRSGAMAQFYQQLTPDQKAKADQLESQFKGRFKNGMMMRHQGFRNQGQGQNPKQ